MNSGQFKKGLIPWNKGKKGIHLSPRTEFKKGEIYGKDHPSWKGGLQINSADCAYINKGCNKRVRRPRDVWERVYGPIPSGWVVVHIDGDKDNDDPKNLICCTRANLLKLNRGKKV